MKSPSRLHDEIVNYVVAAAFWARTPHGLHTLFRRQLHPDDTLSR
jgi:hypothetical protein